LGDTLESNVGEIAEITVVDCGKNDGLLENNLREHGKKL